MEPFSPPHTPRTFEVTVERAASYRVHHEVGLLQRYGTVLRESFDSQRLVVLTDRRVDSIYGVALRESLAAADYQPNWIVVPAGERTKTLATFRRAIAELTRLGTDRRALLVNFGGGVISDMGGFVAASYMRGIRYVNFPTSLIGQVDASVGGKVALNAPEAKNLIGAFHHPSHVAADPNLISTLGERDFRSGMAEAIKVGIIASPRLFSIIERDRASLRGRLPSAIAAMTLLAAHVKMDLIGLDPYETDLRRALNFGHTLGHPIETDFEYQNVRHGEAVAIGMGVATAIALREGMIAPNAAERIFDLLDAYGLIGCVGPLNAGSIVEHLRCVRMIRGNALNFVLPTAIGSVEIVTELTTGQIVDGFQDYERIARQRRDPRPRRVSE